MNDEVIPAQDTTAMLRKLTPEEFDLLVKNQEKILKDHAAKEIPRLEKLFPTLKMYGRIDKRQS